MTASPEAVHPETDTAARWARLPAPSRRQQVVDQLREAIVTGVVQPGEQLKQESLSSDFGVSPGPVREALRQLQSEGLVEHYPNRGVFVTDVSTDEFLGVLLPVRLAIEAFAVPLAAHRMDESAFGELEALLRDMEREVERDDLRAINELDVQFHERTVEASGSAHALQLWHSVLPRIRAQIYRLAPRHHDLVEIVDEHRRLLEALRGRDVDVVRAEIEHHIIGTNELLAGAKQPPAPAASPSGPSTP